MYYHYSLIIIFLQSFQDLEESYLEIKVANISITNITNDVVTYVYTSGGAVMFVTVNEPKLLNKS